MTKPSVAKVTSTVKMHRLYGVICDQLFHEYELTYLVPGRKSGLSHLSHLAHNASSHTDISNWLDRMSPEYLISDQTAL